MQPRDLFVRPDGATRGGWRALFFVASSVAIGILGGGLVIQVLELTPLVSWARLLRIPLDQLVTVAAFLAGTRLSVKVFDPGSASPWSAAALGPESWSPRSALFGLAVGAATIGVPALALVAGGRSHFAPSPDSGSTWWLALREHLFLLVPAALGEEVAVRGYALTALRDAMGTTRAVVLSSVVFGLLHLFNPDPTVISTLAVALAGAFLAVVRFSTGSLVAAWMAHLAWNLVQSALLHAPVSGLALPVPGYRLVDDGPAWLTGGPWGPEGGVAAAASLAVATFVLGRWRMADGRTPDTSHQTVEDE